MSKVRSRPETGTLYLDFFFQGVRCREQTALPDTVENRRRVQMLLNRIEKEIKQGSFDYLSTFPNSARAKRLSVPALSKGRSSPAQASYFDSAPARPNPTFSDFSVTWRSEMAPQWRRLHRNSVDAIFDAHLLPAFGDRPLAAISKADVLSFRANLATLPGRTSSTLSPASINKVVGILRQCMTEASERFGLPDVFRGVKRLKARRPDVQPFTLDEVERNDAAIIDAAEAIQTQSGSPVLVLTRDVLLATRCKRRGTNCFLISPEDEEWNDRPERPDPEITELKRELEEFKRQRPVIELELESLGGSIGTEVLSVLAPKITRFERIDFVSQWAVKYFEKHEPRNPSREWDFDDHAWARELHDLDIDLSKLLAKRLAGATIWLTVKNTSSVNAEDVRIELLADGPWLLARDIPDRLIEVPRPPLRRNYDPNALFIPSPILPNFSTPMIEPLDPSAPIWEVEERDDQPKGVSRLAIRIPVLRHRDAVDVPFRLGADADAGTAGKLIIRITTEKTPKPVVRTLRLECETKEVSTDELFDLLIERKELEISLEPTDQ